VRSGTGTEEVLRCSFCHKSQDAVSKLISSPSDYPRAYICAECVAVCNSILEDDRGEQPAATAAGHLPKPTCSAKRAIEGGAPQRHVVMDRWSVIL